MSAAQATRRKLLLKLAARGYELETGNRPASALEGARTNAGARVELVGTDNVAMTNDKGEFTLRNLPSGTNLLLHPESP